MITKATLIRIGEGQTASGHILDKGTKWYILTDDLKNPMAVYDEAVRSGKPIFYKGRNGYVRIDLEQLKTICERYMGTSSLS